MPGPRGEDRRLRDGARHLPGGLLPQGRQGHAARQVDAARSLPGRNLHDKNGCLVREANTIQEVNTD